MSGKAITKCPKCGSRCLWYKPDGSVFCMVCKNQYNKEEMAVCKSKKQPAEKSAN
jgi:uncharacterized Zn finger protein (UPF0148 family)